jgi:hypothetical protein
MSRAGQPQSAQQRRLVTLASDPVVEQRTSRYGSIDISTALITLVQAPLNSPPMDPARCSSIPLQPYRDSVRQMAPERGPVSLG